MSPAKLAAFPGHLWTRLKFALTDKFTQKAHAADGHTQFAYWNIKLFVYYTNSDISIEQFPNSLRGVLEGFSYCEIPVSLATFGKRLACLTEYNLIFMQLSCIPVFWIWLHFTV